VPIASIIIAIIVITFQQRGSMVVKYVCIYIFSFVCIHRYVSYIYIHIHICARFYIDSVNGARKTHIGKYTYTYKCDMWHCYMYSVIIIFGFLLGTFVGSYINSSTFGHTLIYTLRDAQPNIWSGEWGFWLVAVVLALVVLVVLVPWLAVFLVLCSFGFVLDSLIASWCRDFAS